MPPDPGEGLLFSLRAAAGDVNDDVVEDCVLSSVGGACAAEPPRVTLTWRFLGLIRVAGQDVLLEKTAECDAQDRGAWVNKKQASEFASSWTR